VCVLCIPEWASLRSLCALGGVSARDIESAKRVLDPIGGKAALALDFRSAATANAFVEKASGNPFDNKRPEICYAVYLSRPASAGQYAPRNHAGTHGTQTMPQARLSTLF
jgi:hypothetical protein